MVCKKLHGTAAGSASWCTNIRNERSEVLVTVLTESEGLDLRPMAMGVIERFGNSTCNSYFIVFCSDTRRPSRLLYTDRDCCGFSGVSQCARLFEEWDHLQVSRNLVDPYSSAPWIFWSQENNYYILIIEVTLIN